MLGKSATMSPTMMATSGAIAIIAMGICFFIGPNTYMPTLKEIGDHLFGILGGEFMQTAVPPIFSRFTVPASRGETHIARCAWAAAVGAAFLARPRLWNTGHIEDFTLPLTVHAASYFFMVELPLPRWSRIGCACAGVVFIAFIVWCGRVVQVFRVLCCVGICFATGFFGRRLVGRYAPTVSFSAGLVAGALFLWYFGTVVTAYLMPVDELSDAFAIVSEFVSPERLNTLSLELLLLTINIQVPLGFLGIAFLRRAQERTNNLVAVGEHKKTAQQFAYFVLVYMLTVALPYMLQRMFISCVNEYAYGQYAREVERSLRVESIFPVEHGNDALLVAVGGKKLTVGATSAALNNVVGTSYGLIKRKFFSLPKLVLLPGLLWSKPWLMATLIPASIALDVGKSVVVATLAKHIEAFNRQVQDLASKRQRVEQHDTKNEELIRRGGVSHLARAKWLDMSKKLAELDRKRDALHSVVMFIEHLYWQDFMIPGIECTLGFLLELGHITNVDIWVSIRVVEDAIDTLLTRTRMQTKLATMQTNMNRLQELLSGLADAKNRTRPRCEIDPTGNSMRFNDVDYKRGGSLHVRIPSFSLTSGRVYAVSGANGCGKSTIFAIIAGCGRQGTALPPGTDLGSQSKLILPSDEIVEVTQQCYCPLFIKPIAWMLHMSNAELPPMGMLQQDELRIMELLTELNFRSIDNQTSTSNPGFNSTELHTEHPDWYGSLSGGQRVKAELIRKVFLRDTCPNVLLLDEAFGPLDPSSKALIMRKLKSFCAKSLVLVIYHTEANKGCVERNDFFDENMHFENGTVRLIDTC